MLATTRAEARAAGARWYFTGEPCKAGHTVERSVSTGHCRECRRLANHKPEAVAARKEYSKTEASKRSVRESGRRWYHRNKDYYDKWVADNKDRIRDTQRRYYERNKAERNAARQAWREANRERDRENYAAWRDANRDILRAHHRTRYEIKRNGTVVAPEHRTFVSFMYEMARDLGLQVDHVIPLRNKRVCGLHTLLNLRLLSPELNNCKNNKFAG